jgi:hypothetical protein
MRKITKRSATVAAAVVIAVGGGTAAFAYATGWFQGGGTAAAYSSTIQPVTATIVIPDTAHLYPGASIPLTGAVTNPNDYKVKVTSVSVTSVSAIKNGATNTDCVLGTADLHATFGTQFDVNSQATNNGQSVGTLTMGGDAVPQCAGSRITAVLQFGGELTS